MAKEPRRRSYPTAYSVFRTKEVEGDIELWRVEVRKVPLQPGTSVLVSIMPISSPKPRGPINTEPGRRKPPSKSPKWTKERNYLIRSLYGPRRLPNKGDGTSERELRRNCLPVCIPANLDYGLFEYCLVWCGALDGGGYGVVKGEKVHRLAYAYANGVDLEKSHTVNHLCHRPYCIQPGHLYIGTPGDNALDRDVKLKGKLRPDWLTVVEGPSENLVSSLADTVRHQGRPLLEYAGQMKRLSLDAASTAWEHNEPAQGPLLLSVMPEQCPEHSFRIQSGNDWICSLCNIIRGDAVE